MVHTCFCSVPPASDEFEEEGPDAAFWSCPCASCRCMQPCDSPSPCTAALGRCYRCGGASKGCQAAVLKVGCAWLPSKLTA
ncbi:hypothetical protein ABBQ32_006743 [Trebouxia sp. C0010 RCD-2024]